jgi:anti-sigma factor RsiW
MLECRDIDALMMDWLYQELQPQQSSSFDAHVSKCARCQAEMAGMKRTREALRELPQVEPPPSISQILLHEAARKAPAAAAVEPVGGGRRGFVAWLGDLFTPIARHPAATAVATLVVVVGVAGALYVRGEHQVVEPMADSRAAADGRAGAAAAEHEALNAGCRSDGST